VPSTTLRELLPAEPGQRRAILRRTRYGSLLAFPIVLLWAAGRTPTEMAACLFGSRSSVYRIGRAYRAGSLGLPRDPAGQRSSAVPSTIFMPGLTRALGASLKKAPRAYGWGRTRWRWATLAATLQAHHGLEGSVETGRRGLHAIGWGWKRATRVANDAAPPRGERLARMRLPPAHWRAHEVIVCAAARDMPLLPPGGAAWMPQGPQAESMTPGTHEQHSRAGARPRAPGPRLYGLGARKNTGLCRDLLTRLDTTSPASSVPRLYVVVENDCMHKAQAVTPWWARHPRLEVRGFPPYCPRANPIARAFGDVHDTWTRHHQRKRLRDLGKAVERHIQEHGPGQDQLSQLYQAPDVTAAVEQLAAEAQARIAA